VAGLIEALQPVVALVLGVLLDLLRRRARSTSEDAAPDDALRDRLAARVRRHWLVLVMALVLPLLAAGCGTRTIYVADGQPVRLRETVRDAKVWVHDAAGKTVAGRMDLPEGWYALPVDETQQD
jgi:ABC-type Fe3+ transport system permease subunit